jgi:hypothetical protein
LVKFKTVYILFNAVILLSFAFVFFLPLIMLGPDFFSVFLSRNWIAVALFLATLVIVNAYFLRNWKLFRSLEREDWSSVIALLEQRVLVRRRLTRNSVKMLVNAYLITSRLDAILELSQHVEEHRPALMKRFALAFGIPHLLRNDPEAAERFFGRFRGMEGAADRSWLAWNYAFALLQQRKVDLAKAVLLEVLERKPEPALELLTLYMLGSAVHGDEEVRERVQAGRRELTRRYTPETWKQALDSESKNMEVVLLSPIVRDATTWLFSEVEGQ